MLLRTVTRGPVRPLIQRERLDVVRATFGDIIDMQLALINWPGCFLYHLLEVPSVSFEIETGTLIFRAQLLGVCAVPWLDDPGEYLSGVRGNGSEGMISYKGVVQIPRSWYIYEPRGATEGVFIKFIVSRIISLGPLVRSNKLYLSVCILLPLPQTARQTLLQKGLVRVRLQIQGVATSSRDVVSSHP